MEAENDTNKSNWVIYYIHLKTFQSFYIFYKMLEETTKVEAAVFCLYKAKPKICLPWPRPYRRVFVK